MIFKRCKICNHRIHMHKKGHLHGYILKNTCEHIPEEKRMHITDKELDEYFK